MSATVNALPSPLLLPTSCLLAPLSQSHSPHLAALAHDSIPTASERSTLTATVHNARHTDWPGPRARSGGLVEDRSCTTSTYPVQLSWAWAEPESELRQLKPYDLLWLCPMWFTTIIIWLYIHMLLYNSIKYLLYNILLIVIYFFIHILYHINYKLYFFFNANLYDFKKTFSHFW